MFIKFLLYLESPLPLLRINIVFILIHYLGGSSVLPVLVSIVGDDGDASDADARDESADGHCDYDDLGGRLGAGGGAVVVLSQVVH